jgi:hypothetical protein
VIDDILERLEALERGRHTEPDTGSD